jgi:hypothetical protein
MVSARRPDTPSFCACCGAPAPDASITTVPGRWKRGRGLEAGRPFDFPACRRCLEHVKAVPSPDGYVIASVLTAGLGAPFFILFYLRRKRAAIAMRSPSCEAVGCVARCEHWYATEHTFRFDSVRYARAFADMNRAEGRKVSERLDEAPAGTLRSGPVPIVIALGLILGIAAFCGSAMTADPRNHREAIARQNDPVPLLDAGTVDAGRPHDAGHHRPHHRTKSHR